MYWGLLKFVNYNYNLSLSFNNQNDFIYKKLSLDDAFNWNVLNNILSLQTLTSIEEVSTHSYIQLIFSKDSKDICIEAC